MAVKGLGTDIVEIARLSNNPKTCERLARRVLTDAEFALFSAHHYPARYLAKRYAAKEAMVKAAGTGIGKGIGFTQMEVLNKANGEPFMTLSGALKALCDQRGISRIWLTISDEQAYATATVLLEGND